MWIPFQKQLRISRDVLVVESSSHSQATNPRNGIHGDENQQNNKDFQFEVIIEEIEPSQVLQIPIREWRPPRRLEDFVTITKFANITNSLEDPRTLAKVLTRDDAHK